MSEEPKKKRDILLQLIIALIGSGLGAFIAHFLAEPHTVDITQGKYAEEKLTVYLGLSRMLRDGRNPHGFPPKIDMLPIHWDSVSFAKWWRNIDDYYQANIIL